MATYKYTVLAFSPESDVQRIYGKFVNSRTEAQQYLESEQKEHAKKFPNSRYAIASVKVE